MGLKPPGKYTATGAALGTTIYPGVGTVVGGVAGWLGDQFSGGDAPEAKAGTPYNVNPGAYGGLPVNFGAPESQQTGSYADAYNGTIQQMQSDVAQLQAQKEQNHRDLVAAGQPPEGLANADKYFDDLISQKQQQYAPALQAAMQQYQASQHQDQLQGLVGNAQASQSRQAPQINQGAYLNGSGGGGSYGQGAPGAPQGGGGSYGGGSNVSQNGTVNLNPGPQAGAVIPQAGAQAGGAGQGAFNPAGQSAAGLYNQLSANGAAANSTAVRNRAGDLAGQSRTFDTQGMSSGQIANQVIDNTTAANAAAAPPPPDNPLYIDYQNQLQARAQQGQLISQLQDAAAGRGPSAAQAQLQQGLDANIAQAQSMARSARGGSGAQALAARTATMGGVQATQQTANQAAQLRAQEMQQAYGQLGAALQSQRGGDLSSRNTSAGIATNNAQMQLQQGQQNDQNSQYFYSLYMSALAGDRDAQMQLQQMNSNNYNASQGYGLQANAQNSQNYWNQVGQTNKVVGGVANAIGAVGQSYGAQGGGAHNPAQNDISGSAGYGDGFEKNWG